MTGLISQYCPQTKQYWDEKILAEPGVKPGAAGWEAQSYLCAMLPPTMRLSWKSYLVLTENEVIICNLFTQTLQLLAILKIKPFFATTLLFKPAIAPDSTVKVIFVYPSALWPNSFRSAGYQCFFLVASHTGTKTWEGYEMTKLFYKEQQPEAKSSFYREPSSLRVV